MSVIFKIFLPMFAAYALSGCVSSPPIYSESFIASINEAQMHQFHFQVATQTDGKAGSPRRRVSDPGEPSGRRGGMIDNRVPAIPSKRDIDAIRRERQGVEDFMQKRLLEILTDTRFCANGFFIIEKRINPTAGSIFGECKTVAP